MSAVVKFKQYFSRFVITNNHSCSCQQNDIALRNICYFHYKPGERYQISPTIVTQRHKAPWRGVNYKKFHICVSTHLVLEQIKVARERQETIYKGTSVWYSLRSSSQQHFHCEPTDESHAAWIIVLGKCCWHAHWTGKNTMNSSMEQVCNPHFVRANDETTEETINMCHLCNHPWSGDNSGAEVRDTLPPLQDGWICFDFYVCFLSRYGY